MELTRYESATRPFTLCVTSGKRAAPEPAILGLPIKRAWSLGGNFLVWVKRSGYPDWF
jgi:hypothetical protein